MTACSISKTAAAAFAGLNTRLMIGIDVDQLRVKADSSLKECDQLSNRVG